MSCKITKILKLISAERAIGSLSNSYYSKLQNYSFDSEGNPEFAAEVEKPSFDTSNNDNIKVQNTKLDLGSEIFSSDAPEPVKQAKKPKTTPTEQVSSELANQGGHHSSEKKWQHEIESINDIVSFHDYIKNFKYCELKKSSQNTVIGDGNYLSKVLVIGEAPGKNEDEEGIPFCGKSGDLLNEMLGCIGLSRSNNCYISNIVFWRPPLNRKPSSEELSVCKPLTEKHIALIDPDIIITVGSTSTENLISLNGITFTESVGKVYDYSNKYTDKKIKLMPIYHPSFLFRQPYKKKVNWVSLLNLKEKYL